MNRFGRFIALALTKATFFVGIYLGYEYHSEISKLWLNTLERRTPIASGCYQNPGDLEIFLDKVDGEMVPSYGVGDYKIRIGRDMLPLGVYKALERPDSNSEKGHVELDKGIDSILPDTLVTYGRAKVLSDALLDYLQSDGPAKEHYERRIDKIMERY